MTASSIGPRAAESFSDAQLRSSGWVVAVGLAAAIGIGIVSVVTAWRLPGFSSASESVLATTLTLLAGFGLVGMGLEHVRRGRRRRFGLLLACAGIAWLLAEWANPAIESPIGFTIGLALGWLYPAVVVHALLVFGGRLGRGDVVVVAAGYTVFGVLLGLLPALTFDAAAIHCSFCPTDLVAIIPSSELAGALDRCRNCRRRLVGARRRRRPRAIGCPPVSGLPVPASTALHPRRALRSGGGTRAWSRGRAERSAD